MRLRNSSTILDPPLYMQVTHIQETTHEHEHHTQVMITHIHETTHEHHEPSLISI